MTSSTRKSSALRLKILIQLACLSSHILFFSTNLYVELNTHHTAIYTTTQNFMEAGKSINRGGFCNHLGGLLPA